MYIKALRLVNYKKFDRRHMTFDAGLNVVIGANEAGKSTVIDALQSALVGRAKSDSADSPDGLIELTLSDAGQQIILQRRADRRQATIWQAGRPAPTKTTIDIYQPGNVPDIALREKLFVISHSDQTEERPIIAQKEWLNTIIAQAFPVELRDPLAIRQRLTNEMKAIYTNHAHSRSALAQQRREREQLYDRLAKLRQQQRANQQVLLKWRQQRLALAEATAQSEDYRAKRYYLQEIAPLHDKMKTLAVLNQRIAEQGLTEVANSQHLARYLAAERELQSLDNRLAEIESNRRDLTATASLTRCQNPSLYRLFGKPSGAPLAHYHIVKQAYQLRQSALAAPCDRAADCQNYDDDSARASLTALHKLLSNLRRQHRRRLLLALAGLVCAALLVLQSVQLTALQINNWQMTLAYLLMLSSALLFTWQSLQLRRTRLAIARQKDNLRAVLPIDEVAYSLEVLQAHYTRYLTLLDAQQQRQQQHRAYREITKKVTLLWPEEQDNFWQIIDSIAAAGEIDNCYQGAIDAQRSRRDIAEIDAHLSLLRAEKTKVSEQLKALGANLQTIYGSTDVNYIEAQVDYGAALVAQAQQLEYALNSVDDAIKQTPRQNVDYSAAQLDELIDRQSEQIATLKQALSQAESQLNQMPDDQIDRCLAEISASDQQIEQLKEHYDEKVYQRAIVDALINVVSVSSQPRFIERANQLLSKIIAPPLQLSLGRAGRLQIADQSLEKPLAADQLSSATRNQVELVLKIALLDYFDASYQLPLLLDDVFISYDDQRCQGFIELIGEISQYRQLIITTHDKAFGQAFNNHSLRQIEL